MCKPIDLGQMSNVVFSCMAKRITRGSWEVGQFTNSGEGR